MSCLCLHGEEWRKSCAGMELSCIVLLQAKLSLCKAGFWVLAWPGAEEVGREWSEVGCLDKPSDMIQICGIEHWARTCCMYMCMYKIMVIDFKIELCCGKISDYIWSVVETDPSSLVNFFLLRVPNSQDFIMNLTVVVDRGDSCSC